MSVFLLPVMSSFSQASRRISFCRFDVWYRHRGAMTSSLRDECPDPLRHLTVGRRRADWTAAEREHMKHCERCRNIQLESFRSDEMPLCGLIADDSEEALKFIEMALKPLNAELTSVQDGDAVLTLAREASARHRPYDFFVLDNWMGEDRLAGCRAGAALRRSGYSGRTPVLLVTDKGIDRAVQQECHDHRMAYLSKDQVRLNLLPNLQAALAGLP